MTTFDYTLWFLGVFFAGLAWVSWQSRYHDKGRGFIIGHRELGFWAIFSSVISFFHAGDMFFWWFSFVAMVGFGAIWICAAIMASLFIMGLFAPKAAQLSRQNNYITFPDLIRDRQGPLMEKWVLCGSLYGAAALTAAQLYVAGNILGGLLNVSTVVGTLIGATVVGIYVTLGGFLSVVRTDIYQSAVMIVLALGALLFGNWPESSIIIEQVTSPDINLIASFIVLGLAIPMNTDMWQRFFAAKVPAQARSATVTAFIINQFIVMFGIILFITNMLATAPDTNPEQVFIELFSHSTADPMVVALFGVFIVSAILSTLDNQVFNFTAISTRNILGIDPFQNRDKFIWRLRAIALLMLATLTVLSLTIENLMQWLVTSYAVLGVLTPFVFYAICRKSTARYGDKILAAGVLAGAVIYWIVYYLFSYENAVWYLVPYCVPMIFILADYLYRNPAGNKALITPQASFTNAD